LFDAGLRQAQLQIAKAQFTEAAENYRSTVLRALKEVQDELSSLRWLAQEYNETTTAATAARKAADLSLTLYRDGASSYLDVVTAQSAALDVNAWRLRCTPASWSPTLGSCLRWAAAGPRRPNRSPSRRALRPISRSSPRSLHMGARNNP
jgi:hypothetical protein